jgi:bacillithiol biosynthesis deacetylase BshB1
MEAVDYLFISAHPDDTELSCGGTIARLAKEGRRVGMVDLTKGEMGTRGTPAVRKREAASAARILGAAFREQLDFPDGNLPSGREWELKIIDVVRRTRPAIVIAPWPDERHPDHIRAGRIITDASFYAGLKKIESGVPAHRPQAVLYYMQNYVQPPSFVIDVTPFWKTKMRAIAAFRSQFHNPKSKETPTFIADPKFLSMIEARSRHWGALIGVEYGEAYVSKQPPQIDDIAAAFRGREV